MAPSSALLQVNAADAQNELEVISVFLSLSLLFSFLVVALLWAHVIGRVRIYFGVQVSVFHGRITFVCFPVSEAFLHIKCMAFFPKGEDCLLPSWWIP